MWGTRADRSIGQTLVEERGKVTATEQKHKDATPNPDAGKEGKPAPRVGVFVCHCGSNIAGVVDCGKVRETAEKLPGVVVAKENKYTCSDLGQEEIIKAIKENGVERVVVASCSPRLHEPTFRNCIQQAGLNPYLLQMVNITRAVLVGPRAREGEGHREGQRPRAHGRLESRQARATRGEGGAGRADIARDRRRRRWNPGRARPREHGVQGLSRRIEAEHRRRHGPAGQDLPDGRLRHLHTRPEDGRAVEASEHHAPLILRGRRGQGLHRKLRGEGQAQGQIRPRGQVRRLRRVRRGLPRQGRQRVRPGVRPEEGDLCPVPAGRPAEVHHRQGELPALQDRQVPALRQGVLEQGHRPRDEGRGPHPEGRDDHRRHRLRDLRAQEERRLQVLGVRERHHRPRAREAPERLGPDGRPSHQTIRRQSPKRVAFIQCVGSRNKKIGNNYCSRVCCMYAIKNAQIIKEHEPDTEIAVYYNDIRAFGKGFEELYHRSQGGLRRRVHPGEAGEADPGPGDEDRQDQGRGDPPQQDHGEGVRPRGALDRARTVRGEQEDREDPRDSR